MLLSWWCDVTRPVHHGSMQCTFVCKICTIREWNSSWWWICVSCMSLSFCIMGLEAGLSDIACEHVPYIIYVVPKYCASESFSIEYTCTIVGLVLLSILRTFVVDQAQIITNHCRSVRFTAVVSLDESPSRKRDSDLDSQCFDSDHFAVFFLQPNVFIGLLHILTPPKWYFSFYVFTKSR